MQVQKRDGLAGADASKLLPEDETTHGIPCITILVSEFWGCRISGLRLWSGASSIAGGDRPRGCIRYSRLIDEIEVGLLLFGDTRWLWRGMGFVVEVEVDDG